MGGGGGDEGQKRTGGNSTGLFVSTLYSRSPLLGKSKEKKSRGRTSSETAHKAREEGEINFRTETGRRSYLGGVGTRECHSYIDYTGLIGLRIRPAFLPYGKGSSNEVPRGGGG